jgi:hypothetical protein
VWYVKYRLPDGSPVQKKIGPAWTECGRPPAGYVTKRLAVTWLRDVLDQERRGPLPGMVPTGATFADAAAEFLRYVADERGCKPSTLRDYRSIIEAHLLPELAPSASRTSRPRRSRHGAHRSALAWSAARRTSCSSCCTVSFDTRAGCLGAAAQFGGRHREVPPALERRYRRLLARGGARARARRRQRAGWRDLPHGGVHRSSPWRVASEAGQGSVVKVGAMGRNTHDGDQE